MGDLRTGLRRAGLGFVAGGIVGVPCVAVYFLFPNASWAHVAALTEWCGAEAWVVYWGEKCFARHWLRVLIGPEEERLYRMEKRRMTVGKLDTNDIPLPDSQEIYPYHCEIVWVGDHFEIVDDEQGGVVLVNYRQISDQTLKPGDLVKIGSVLLQYGEGAPP